MEAWQIALIVISIIVFIFFFILPSIIFTYAGRSVVKTLEKSDGPARDHVKMDVSFYDNGPTKPLAEEGVKFLNTLPHEDIYITSFDGLKLHAYLYKNPKMITNKYFLGMHGFKSGPLHEFAPYAKKYFELGFNLILPDERANYLSEGKYLTMGIKEQYDALEWCKYIVSRYGEDIKILIQGVSMGGATVCSMSNLDLPKQVIGIVSDCAYSSMLEEIKFTMKNFKMPSFPVVNVINSYLKRCVGISFKDKTPLEAVKESKVPILFCHGEKDQMVPSQFSKDLYEACTSKKLLYIVKGANHAESVSYDIDKYFSNIKEFFNL